jgi:hypothetical protein
MVYVMTCGVNAGALTSNGRSFMWKRGLKIYVRALYRLSVHDLSSFH